MGPGGCRGFGVGRGCGHPRLNNMKMILWQSDNAKKDINTRPERDESYDHVHVLQFVVCSGAPALNI